MARNFAVFILLAVYSPSFSQLPNGSPAPDFDVQDVFGNTYSLFALMGSNKSACVGFEATWCSFCWHLHESGVLQQVATSLASNTTVIMMESEFNTNTDCLFGLSSCNSYTWGDWVTGMPYWVADLSNSNGPNIAYDYARTYYPTLYVISPDKRTWEIIERSYQNYSNWITKSFTLNATATLTSSSCGDNGKIMLNATGGFSSLTYKWSNGATSKDLVNLPGGTYSVTITDANKYFKSFGPFVIDGPDKRLDVTDLNLVQVKCYNESSGSISVQLNYGTPPYLYNWSNGITTANNPNLKAGSYSLTITDSHSCSRTKSYTINQPPVLSVTLNAVKELCDNNDGLIQTKALGGFPPYNYDIGFGQQSGAEFKNLKGGQDYSVTVTDFNGCSESIKTHVDVTHKPTSNAGTDKPIDCIKEIISLDGSKSDQASWISAQWTTKDGNIVKGAETLIPEINKPGTYYLKVTNNNNKCFDLDSMVVIDKREFPDILTSGDTVLNCKLTETQLTGSSKNLPVKFYWTKLNDTSYLSNTISIQVNDTGRFVFNVKDTVNLCVSKDTLLVTSDKRQPVVIVNVNKDISCKNKEIYIDGSQSSMGTRFIYSWSTLNGNIVSGSHSLFPLINKGGDYSMQVMDTINQCTNSTFIFVAEQTQPIADFIKNSNGLSVQFNDNSKGIPKFWRWDFGDGTGSDEKNPQHTYSAKGQYQVCLVINNDCGQDSNCQNLVIGNSVTLNCPANVNESTCQTQASIDSKFESWLATASFTGGCNALLRYSYNEMPTLCGGTTLVTFTVTSSCDPTVTCAATFTVTPPSAVVINCPAVAVEMSCQTQAEINSKFFTWLKSCTYNGGCNPDISYSSNISPGACGGTQKVTFSVISLCEQPKTCSSTFTVTNSPTVILTCPSDQIEEAGQTQAQIDAKYAAWLSTTTFTGGCKSSLSSNDTGAPPNTGGSVSVRFIVTTSCDVPKTCSATFVVKDLVASNNPISFKKFELIPNPTNDKGFIQIELDKRQVITLSILNVLGKTIWINEYNTGKENIPIDLSRFTKGLYFVVMTTENSRTSLKWIVN